MMKIFDQWFVFPAWYGSYGSRKAPDVPACTTPENTNIANMPSKNLPVAFIPYSFSKSVEKLGYHTPTA
jgi:hypothetical protein